MIILVYVDDVVITGPCKQHITSLIGELNLIFSLKDLGNLNFFMGLEVTRGFGSLYLTQV